MIRHVKVPAPYLRTDRNTLACSWCGAEEDEDGVIRHTLTFEEEMILVMRQALSDANKAIGRGKS